MSTIPFSINLNALRGAMILMGKYYCLKERDYVPRFTQESKWMIGD